MTGNIERVRVLLVDDYPDTRSMYGEYLQEYGYDVLTAANGVDALKLAFEKAPDIIVMDLSLPLMDGWEAARRLKADSRTSATPLVAMSAHALTGVSEGALKAGCNAFLTKPCFPEDLLKEIRRFVPRS